MILTEHFTLEELTKSDTASRKGIENEPDAEAIKNLIAVSTMILEKVRNHYGIPFSPNSGFRCLKLNREIGSSDKSQHVEGKAVDFEDSGILQRRGPSQRLGPLQLRHRQRSAEDEGRHF